MKGDPLTYCDECGNVTPHRILTEYDRAGNETTILECRYSRTHHGIIPVDNVDY